MALVIRLRERVYIDTVWLERKEWVERFRGKPAELGSVLDESAHTVVEDLGGFAHLVRSSAWVDAATRICTACGREKPTLAFRTHIPNNDNSLLGFRTVCSECDNVKQLYYRGRRQILLPAKAATG